jgi:hypothetical protein
MIPSLLMIGFGRSRRVWLPLPFFLIWPFWLIGWLAWMIIGLVHRVTAAKIALFQILLWHLSGLRVDIEDKDESQIHIRFI